MSPEVDKYANENTEYWWFFPIVGINISDTTDDFSSPCLGDATLVSKDLLQNRLEQGNYLGPDPYNPFKRIAITEDVESFIAINWKVSQLGAGPESSSENTQLAYDRADVLGALLTLYTAQRSNFSSAAGLCQHVSSRNSRIVAIGGDQKSLYASISTNDHIYFSKAEAPISRSQLVLDLYESKLSPLARILDGKIEIRPDCKTAIVNAMKHLAAGMYVNQHNEIVASAVTCFDIILKNSIGVNDRQVKKRIKKLLAIDDVSAIVDLYKARNEWIHDGGKVTKTTARDGIVLALSVIVEFSKLALQTNSDRISIVRALDDERILTLSDLKGCLVNAVRELQTQDKDLLNLNANERSLTHRLAIYLERQINFLQNESTKWTVDCEYNRDNSDPKRMTFGLSNELISTHDLMAKTVYPDIIVHRRGQSGRENNFAVFEVKKINSSEDTSTEALHDFEKLKAFTSASQEFQYQYGFYLQFNTVGLTQVTLFVDGERVENEQALKHLSEAIKKANE